MVEMARNTRESTEAGRDGTSKTLGRETVEAQLLDSANRRRRHLTLQINLARIALLAGGVILWEVLSGAVVDPFWISSPSAILERFWGWLIDGTLWYHSLSTVTAMVAGFAAGTLGGVSLGLLLGVMPSLGRVLDPFIVTAYSLPRIALAPLFILWLGIGMASKVALAGVVVFFLVFYNTLSGVRGVNVQLVRVVSLMGASRAQIFRKVIIPASSSWIYTGVRISVPYALIGAVVGEIIASNRGLGFLLRRASGYFDTAGTFAALLALSIAALLVHGAVKLAENRSSHLVGSEDESGMMMPTV